MSTSTQLRLALFTCIFMLSINACIEPLLQSNNLEVSDLTREVEENMEKGATLGQIQATADGNINFELISSSPIGAMVIDASSGILSVELPEFFDFEYREQLNAVVKVTSGTDDINVQVKFTLLDVLAPIEDYNRFTKRWETKAFALDNLSATMDNSLSCRLDDVITFSGTGLYTYQAGDNLCNSNNPPMETGTWDLDENLNFILFDKGTEREIEATISTFNESQLSLSSTYLGASVVAEMEAN